MSELVRILPVCRFALNIRMVSAPLSNMLRLFIELTILGMFLYYDLNKMFGIEKTSQNGQFFIKSSILVLRSQHPHGICPLPNMFTRLRELTGSGPFSVQFTTGAEWNVRQWSEHHKTASFLSNHRFWSSDLNIRMVSASLPNM